MVESAEVAAAAAVKLTGLDQPTVRRLRQAKVALEEASPAPEAAMTAG